MDCPQPLDIFTESDILEEFTTDETSMEETNFDFVDDLIDTEIFGSFIYEHLDKETQKLLEDFE